MFLTLQQIKKSFGQGESKVDVLKGIDLRSNRESFVCSLDRRDPENHTLLNIIGGIDRADEGEIVIHGERMADMKEKRLTIYRRKHLGYVFQMYNLIPNLTVRENIEVGAYLSDKPLDVDELLHTLGLYDTATNCRISCPEVSSSELRSDGLSSRIRTSCCAMSRQVRWTIRHPRRS